MLLQCLLLLTAQRPAKGRNVIASLILVLPFITSPQLLGAELPHPVLSRLPEQRLLQLRQVRGEILGVGAHNRELHAEIVSAKVAVVDGRTVQLELEVTEDPQIVRELRLQAAQRFCWVNVKAHDMAIQLEPNRRPFLMSRQHRGGSRITKRRPGWRINRRSEGTRTGRRSIRRTTWRSVRRRITWRSVRRRITWWSVRRRTNRRIASQSTGRSERRWGTGPRAGRPGMTIELDGGTGWLRGRRRSPGRDARCRGPCRSVVPCSHSTHACRVVGPVTTADLKLDWPWQHPDLGGSVHNRSSVCIKLNLV
jgi:hypothetical protein